MFIKGRFANISKINWEKYENCVDASLFVKEIQVFLTTHVTHLKELISETYLLFYLNKLTFLITSKFTSNLYKYGKRVNLDGYFN